MIVVRRVTAVVATTMLLMTIAPALSVVSTAATPTPAPAAESTLKVLDSDLTDDRMLIRFSALRAREGLSEVLKLSNTVTAQVRPMGGGQAVNLDVTPSRPGQAAGSNPQVMLVLDRSGSMKGPRFAAEKRAAARAVDLIEQIVGENVDIGLATFESKVVIDAEPTSNHAEVKRLLRNIKLGDDTALYQAITVAAEALPDRGQRAIVMVTDGANDPTGEPLTAAQRRIQDRYRAKAAALLAQTKNGIDFTGLLIGNDDDNLTPIAPRGSVIRNTSTGLDGALNQVFQATADKLAQELQITASVPQNLRGKSLSVTIRAVTEDGEPIEKLVTLLPPRSQPPTGTGNVQALPLASPSIGARFGTQVVIAALGALFLAMAVLIMNATSAVTAGESKESEVTRRLAFYTLGSNRGKPVAVQEESPRLSDSRFARSAVNLVNRIARQRKLDQALDTRLEKAGLPIRTAEWTLLHLAIAVGSALLLLVAARGRLVGAILGLALGLAVPWLFLSIRTSMRERKFLAQLPDTLQLLAGSLAAGYSLPQAMDAVLRESEAPISIEFNRALIETRLGMPPEDALDGIAARTASKDFSWVVMAIRIQREVGGNLAELLSTVAETLRERERLRRQVSALSAEGRLSGIILGALPLIFALFLIFTKPDYIAPLFDDARGWILLAGGALLLIAGSFWMSRLVKVEV